LPPEPLLWLASDDNRLGAARCALLSPDSASLCPLEAEGCALDVPRARAPSPHRPCLLPPRMVPRWRPVSTLENAPRVVHRTATTRASAGTAVGTRAPGGGLATASRPTVSAAGVLGCDGGDTPTKRANQRLHTRLAQLAFHLCPIPEDRPIPTRKAYQLFFFPLDEVVGRYTLAASITDTRQWHGCFDRPCSKSPHACVLIMMMAPNAGAHLLPEAGARHERTLEAVRCSALLDAGALYSPVK
jgi:hypothetical protein